MLTEKDSPTYVDGTILRNSIVLSILILTLSGFTFAQSSFSEFEKAKQIKLLEATSEDVQRVFKDYRTMAMSNRLVNTENANISIFYSSGNCVDGTEKWNVSGGIVTEIRIHLKRVVKLKSLKLNLSGFKRERLYAQYSDSYVYHNKSLGIAVSVIDNKIENIILMPPGENYSKLCEDQLTNKFYTGEKWFVDSELKHRIREYNGFADVVSLDLSEYEAIARCDTNDFLPGCLDSDMKISVAVNAVDPENDVLTYEYTVSGGKIIGQGKQVVWDLSDVKPGAYKIEVGANDGCGICGSTMTKTIVVRECPHCSVKQNPRK